MQRYKIKHNANYENEINRIYLTYITKPTHLFNKNIKYPKIDFDKNINIKL